VALEERQVPVFGVFYERVQRQASPNWTRCSLLVQLPVVTPVLRVLERLARLELEHRLQRLTGYSLDLLPRTLFRQV
jgi:hypothetical protein